MGSFLKDNSRYNAKGLFSVSPMLFFILLFIFIFLLTGNIYKVSLSVVFTISSVYALYTLRNRSITERIKVFSRGAGQENLMLMLWIFVLAGAFAQTAKDIGAIDAVVRVALHFLPSHLILAGLFVTACFVSLSIGTSVGTVAALVPIATGIATSTGQPTAMLVAAVVGGAFFGDNLSFISDTTIASTKTQGCELKDKFKANFLIVLPAAIITVIIYIFTDSQSQYSTVITAIDYIKMLPYIIILISAICGMNVFVVLAVGNLLSGITGMALGVCSMEDWFVSAGNGIMSMGELIIISMLAGGMLAFSLLFDRLTGKESLGGGDIKLFFMTGLYLGSAWEILFYLILSCLLGLGFAAMKKSQRIPFGPAIAAACFLMLLYGQIMTNWYTGLF